MNREERLQFAILSSVYILSAGKEGVNVSMEDVKDFINANKLMELSEKELIEFRVRTFGYKRLVLEVETDMSPGGSA